LKKKIIQKVTLIQENKYLVWALYIAFMGLIFSVTSHKIEDDDFFWHLSTGKFISENGYVPDKDVFGYSAPNAEWIPFEWGSDLIIYKIYQIGGYNSVYIFRSLIFCLIFFLFFRLFEKLKVNSVISIIFSFLLLIGLFSRFSPRPHIFSYLFLAILIYLFFNYRYIDRTKYFKALYAIPVIFLIWGNLHLGVVTGVLVFLIFLVSEFLTYKYPQKFGTKETQPAAIGDLKKLSLLFLCSVIVLLINPHGINTYTYAYNHTNMKMLEQIAEWISPFSGKIESTFVIVFYKILLFCSAVVLYYSVKKKDPAFGLLAVFFAIYSVRALRFTVDYEIIVMPLLVISTSFLLFKSKNSTINKIFYGNPVKVVLIIVLLYLTVQFQSDNFYITLKYNREAGLGISNRYFPLGLYKFMKDNNVKGTPFNNFDTGGYLKWEMPEEKVFIDSRNLNDELFNEYTSILKMQPGFESKLDKYGVDHVIFFDPMLIRFPDYLKQNITEYLLNNKNWSLVYWDDMSMLFLKNTPANTELINKFTYSIFNPYTAIFNKQLFYEKIQGNPITAKNEAKRKYDSEPNGYFYQGMNDMLSKTLKGK
jgi:hypothetical protein